MRKFFRFYRANLLAELHFFLPFFFLFILFFNYLTPRTSFEKNKDTGNHNALAQALIATNQLEEASHELPLGSPLLTYIDQIKSQPEEIKKQIIFWETVSQELPNYRDAYIKLAILNWKIYRLFDAQKFLARALQIDPNNEVSLKLLSEFK